MSQVAVGSVAPDFSLPTVGGQEVRLSQFRGKNIVLYFYSKNNTSGCTNEANAFSAVYGEIRDSGGEVLGVSRDSVESHEKFRAKLDLPFLLLSDSSGVVSRLYDVIKEKNMYGRKVLGVERTTFIIDRNGVIRQVFRKVKVSGHAFAVVNSLKELEGKNAEV